MQANVLGGHCGVRRAFETIGKYSPCVAWRWEHGSEFHYPAARPGGPASPHPWGARARHFCAGRDAIKAVLEHGRREFGWQRIWIPTYMCPQVVEAILSSALRCLPYPDGPEDGPVRWEGMEVRGRDVVLVVNHFGLRTQGAFDRGEAMVIEDHTHDPWSRWACESTADFALASLRKTLPLPEGAVLWSPRGLRLPKPLRVLPHRQAAIKAKRIGMLLKARYLAGEDVSKESFRKFLLAGEEGIAVGEPSAMTSRSMAALARFPAAAWRAVRRENHACLAQRLERIEGVRVLNPSDTGGCPFSAVAVFDSPGRRDFVRRRLIVQNVFPAVLWPLDEVRWGEIPAAHRSLSARMLSLHCDMRYTKADMEQVSALMAEAVAAYDGVVPDASSRLQEG